MSMCGRYSFSASKEKVNKHFTLNLETNLTPSYNIAPSHHAYLITNDAPKQVQRFKWGLIPHWVKHPKVGNNLINARAESIAGKASFRLPIRKKRCLVLADGFYEWKKYGRAKVPYRITSAENHQLLVFAGIWDEWLTPEGIAIPTFAIITTEPNKEMAFIHNRMPVLLNTLEDQLRWLDNLPLETVLSMLKTPPDGILKTYPVSDKLNKPTYNEPDLHKPMDTPPTLFDFT